MKIPNLRELAMVSGFFLIGNAGNCLFFAFGLPPSFGFIFLDYIAISWALAEWVIADARRLGIRWPFDSGWLIYTFWPVAMPYHIFRTRKTKGVLTIAGFFALFFAAYLIGLAVFFIVVAMRRSPYVDTTSLYNWFIPIQCRAALRSD